MNERGAHWESIYATRPSTELSWYEREPSMSLRLIEGIALSRSSSIVDIGAGVSALADRLLSDGFTDVTILDISEHALGEVRHRLGERARRVTFLHQDVLLWNPGRNYDVWHDRAVFHFLTERTDRDRYVELATETIVPGGSLVLATFADDGPQRCSGQAVSRYSAPELEELFSAAFTLVEHEREEHVTPAGIVQPFTWVVLRRGVVT